MKKEEIEQQPLDLNGGGKAILEWNRTLWLHGPDKKRPTRVEVTVTRRAAGPIVLAEGFEQTELDNCAFRVAQVLKKGGAEHVMSILSATERTDVYYLRGRVGLVGKRAAREALEEPLAKAMAGATLPVRAEWFDDPGWERLLGVFPGYDPAQWKADRQLMVHLIKAGDAVHTRRVVAHRVYFHERDHARDFLREIRKLRFKADGGPKDDPAGRVVVLLERLEPTIATWHLHPVVLAVKAVVAQFGGVYHGWEVELVPSKVPPPLLGPPPG